jgi:hypothetical protein
MQMQQNRDIPYEDLFLKEGMREAGEARWAQPKGSSIEMSAPAACPWPEHNIPGIAAGGNQPTILFCFRKNKNSTLRFAHGFATIGGAGAAIHQGCGGCHESVEEENCCAKHE